MRQTVPEVHTYFDEPTNAACHIAKDPASNAVAIIDSILDFDVAAGRTLTTHADLLIEEITRNGWQVAWILETHVHADHLSAAPYLAEKLGGKIAIGANIAAVQ
jgi:glyoxylase-like metal-dependent hydrolase (beta-lactamase superfamily II)